MAAIEREFLNLEASQGGWHVLFQRLQQISRLNAGTQLVAKTPLNINRNRYRDVLPIDETRVKLQDQNNDYINANFVKVEAVNRTYILTQGPLQHTLGHFWQMVWEQKTAGIVMLNKCMERGMNKCAKYWPDLGENPMMFNDLYVVESTRSEEAESYCLTYLTLHNLETEETRMVLHFHYLQWPDFGVPQTPNVFLEYLLAVRGSGVLDSGVGPTLVHCSAGIGRSGTFCVVDVCLAKLEETRNLNSLNVQELLLDMRKQRLGLIQTPDQLRFSYIAILQGAYNNLGLKNSLYELSQELQAEEEEEKESESEEDSLVSSDEGGNEEGQSGKYPNLTREYGVPYDEDVPPPIPPRPPDTLPTPGPPPPPPTSLPPGPPEIHYHDQRGPLQSLDSQEEEDEPYPQVPHGYENGEVSGSDSEREDKEEEEEEEEAPPIPPRGKSLSPETKPCVSGMNAAREELLNGRMMKTTTGHFLGPGRGDAATQSPPLYHGSAHLPTSVRGGGGGNEDEVPPQVPPKSSRKQGPEVDEAALMSELNEISSLIAEQERRSKTHPTAQGISVSDLRRRSQREERKERVASRISSMKTRDRSHNQEQLEKTAPATTSSQQLSIPWLVLGFAIVVGYCVYYLYTR